MEQCVGCRVAEGPICPDCADLLDRQIEVQRSLLHPILFGSLGSLLIASGLVLIVVYWHSYGVLRAFGGVLIFGVLALIWAARNLQKPWRLCLGESLEVRWFPWRQLSLPPGEVTLELGILSHRESEVRFRLSDMDYPDSEPLRRALRIRIARRR